MNKNAKIPEAMQRKMSKFTGLSPMKQIRVYCVEICQGGSMKNVRLCEDSDCPLFAFRFGKKPQTIVRVRGEEYLKYFTNR